MSATLTPQTATYLRIVMHVKQPTSAWAHRRKSMRSKWTRLLLCVVIAGLTSVWALGQDDTSNKSKGEVRKVTGCLTKSGSGDEYLLTATDGSTWEIHENNAVNLASHV